MTHDLTITFSDAEMDEIRAAAGTENVSLDAFIHEAVLVRARDARIADATARAVRTSRGLSERLENR